MNKILFGLLVATIAVGANAFTSAEKKTTTFQVYLIQPSIGTFTLFYGPPDPNNCILASSHQCIYDIKPEYRSKIPDQLSYTSTEIDYYITQGWILGNPAAYSSIYEP